MSDFETSVDQADEDAVGVGPRLERFLPGDLDNDQRAVYAAITEGPRATGPRLFQVIGDDGALEGPFNVLLLQPRLGMAVQALGSAVRYATTLADRAREIAILVVATRWRCEFEWYAHEAVGRHAGLGEDELAAILDRRYDALDRPDRTGHRSNRRSPCVCRRTRRCRIRGVGPYHRQRAAV